ncbi:hypothetical protein [Eisenbergiella porci]|uniref:hypothetical protein n=1 Tax=Eisenbergiella porci TaxID=2652274 RepID=UPI002A820E53|nr:hypothetical protein [Eisenbergiella porci]
MQEFLKFFDEKVDSYPMHMEIYYSKIMDWCIHVYKKGCGNNGKDLEIVNVQGGDMDLCFAEAQVSLKNWLLENEGGY